MPNFDLMLRWYCIVTNSEGLLDCGLVCFDGLNVFQLAIGRKIRDIPSTTSPAAIAELETSRTITWHVLITVTSLFDVIYLFAANLLTTWSSWVRGVWAPLQNDSLAMEMTGHDRPAAGWWLIRMTRGEGRAVELVKMMIQPRKIMAGLSEIFPEP